MKKLFCFAVLLISSPLFSMSWQARDIHKAHEASTSGLNNATKALEAFNKQQEAVKEIYTQVTNYYYSSVAQVFTDIAEQERETVESIEREQECIKKKKSRIKTSVNKEYNKQLQAEIEEHQETITTARESLRKLKEQVAQKLPAHQKYINEQVEKFATQQQFADTRRFNLNCSLTFLTDLPEGNVKAHWTNIKYQSESPAWTDQTLSQRQELEKIKASVAAVIHHANT